MNWSRTVGGRMRGRWGTSTSRAIWIVIQDGVAYVQAGAGIVADSVPEREYEETLSKARGLLKAIEITKQRVS